MTGTFAVKTAPTGGVRWDLRLPGSKSLSNRAVLLAALSEGETVLTNFLYSDDTRHMTRALRDLGLKIVSDESESRCTVTGGRPPEGPRTIFVGNAGTAMRFLASYLALGRGEFILDGDERMRQRPIADLVDALNTLGCRAQVLGQNGCPPVRIRADGLPGGECSIPGRNSSQYISSILMASPCSRSGVVLKVEGEIASEPYLRMTKSMMASFGVPCEQSGSEFRVAPVRYRSPGSYAVEPDASSASYFLAAAAVLGGEARIRGIGSSSIQGDSRFAEVLAQMGCRVRYSSDSVVLESDSRLRGIDIDLNAMPDMVPTLAVTALFAEGPTRIRNVPNLRIKESDRIAALAAEIGRMGGEAREYPDGLEIFPKTGYHEALIETYNDHRIAMAFTVAGLKVPGIVIADPECVSKSFPGYFDTLKTLF